MSKKRYIRESNTTSPRTINREFDLKTAENDWKFKDFFHCSILILFCDKIDQKSLGFFGFKENSDQFGREDTWEDLVRPVKI